MKVVRTAAALVLAAMIAVGCSSAPASPPSGLTAGHHAQLLTGVYEPLVPGSYWQVSLFAAETGRWPAIVSYYSKWDQPFNSTFASQAAAHGGETLVQIDPRRVALAGIAAGSQDRYLASYATAVKQYGHQVIISFGQEMNGNWYSWGTGHTSPAVYIAAWRHIVDVFRARGATNVTWLWDVNCALPGTSPLSDWWPGSAYVTWAGLDCYYVHPTDTFASLFMPTLAAIRQVTSKPVLIAETAVGPDSGPLRGSQIANLFAGVIAEHLLGFVWFDESQNDGLYHQDWRLEDDSSALAAFRKAEKNLIPAG